MTTAGKVWKRRFVQSLGNLSVEALQGFEVGPNKKYCLEVTLWLKRDALYTKGWGKDKRVKSPFRRIDADNFIKLVQDALSELMGFDDRAIFSISVNKREIIDPAAVKTLSFDDSKGWVEITLSHME